ncbi:nuclear transport factor 2 family protein [Mucilaginibacter sp.]|uniref:nuclear transport factor 2 family protein n=1 Tax=Mucilaginibacter sp. TaxID=1882438 RepID=UPI0035BC1665
MNEQQYQKTNWLIDTVYKGFNSRDIESVLALMHDDIRWPKAFEGGYISGRKAIREYWTRQWSEINPIVKPMSITKRPDYKVEVLVYQLVKDHEGKILFDGNVKHVYELQNDLLRQMDIEIDQE